MVSQSALLERIIEPHRGGFSPEHARYVLSLDFTPEEHALYSELSSKAQDGSLSQEEQAELDAMLAVNAILMILQSKARTSLKKHSPAA